jgi:glutaconate CoA-transferase subunit A
MTNKQVDLAELVAGVESGMTVGIGGWGSRRKPMAAVRALCRTDVRGLTVVAYGGPDIGLLCATGKARRLAYGFVSLDSIPLEPHFRAARQGGAVQVAEYDEGMLQAGLYAAAQRLPFLPTRAGLGSGVVDTNPELRTVCSPYGDGEELLAMPALALDVALIHVNAADPAGNTVISGVDPYFDDLFAMAASRTLVTAERVVPTAELEKYGDLRTRRIPRSFVHAVAEVSGGAWFTSCDPDYGRDENAQAAYAAAAKDPQAWRAWADDHLAGSW